MHDGSGVWHNMVGVCIKRTSGKGQLVQASKGTAYYGDQAAVAPQQLQGMNTTNRWVADLVGAATH